MRAKSAKKATNSTKKSVKKSAKKAVKNKKVKKTLKPKAKKTTKKSAVKSKSAHKTVAKTGKQKKISKLQFTEDEKAKLLTLIKQIVDIHKKDQGGLKGLDSFDRILDQYNQCYADSSTKFDAIVKLGAKKTHVIDEKHQFLDVHQRDQDLTDFYKELTNISKNKLKYDEAVEHLIDVYEESRTMRGEDKHIEFDYTK